MIFYCYLITVIIQTNGFWPLLLIDLLTDYKVIQYE